MLRLLLPLFPRTEAAFELHHSALNLPPHIISGTNGKFLLLLGSKWPVSWLRRFRCDTGKRVRHLEDGRGSITRHLRTVLQLRDETDTVVHFLLDALQFSFGSLEPALGEKVCRMGLCEPLAHFIALGDTLDYLLL